MTNKIITLIACAFLFTACSKSIRTPNELMENYAESARKIKSPFMGTVLIAKDQKLVFKEAYGFSDREQEIRNTVDTKFPVGSITKQFTAMLVMQLVQSGDIGLEDTLSNYLDYLPESFTDQFTIHQLLSHTSGLPHYEGIFNNGIDPNEFAATYYSPRDLAKLVSNVELLSEPGTSYHYSSLGYMLLGVVLEEVTGLSYAQLLKERITQPLGLKNTGYASNDFIQNETAKGYAFVEDETFTWLFKKYGGDFENVKFRDQSNTYSTGGIHSTVEDLYKWSEAIRNHILLNRELTAKMLTPNMEGYCYGWIKNWDDLIERNTTVRMITHGGALFGHRSSITLYDDGTTIIFLSNVSPIKDMELVHKLYLAAHQIPDTLRLKGYPDRSSLSVFERAGGIGAFNRYFNTLSNLSGYRVLPSQGSIAHLMQLYGEAGDFERVDSIKQVFYKDYNPSESTINRIAYGLLEENCDLALEFFRENTDRNPNSPNAWDSLGEGLQECSNGPEAIEYFEKAVTLARSQGDPSLELYEKNLSKAQKELLE